MGSALSIDGVRVFALTKSDRHEKLASILRHKPELADLHRDKHQNTALNLATINRSVDTMRVLLEARADPNTTNNQDWTPLIGAAANNFPEGVELLLQYGADPRIKAKGRSALDWAVQVGSVQCTEILRHERGALNAQLVDMGFEASAVERALAVAFRERNEGQFEAALETLIDDQLKRVTTEQRRRRSIPNDDDDDEDNDRHNNDNDDGDDDEKECVVCLSEERNTVFVPCGHLVACLECANQLASCPICRTPKKLAQRVYM